MREPRVVIFAAAVQVALVSACAGGAVTAPRAPDAAELQTVRIEDLLVTSGAIAPGVGAVGELAIRSPSVRAVLRDRGRDAVDLSFVYRGPSAEVAPLASGEVRRQIGLKLLAQDTCNVVYVMWHIAPTTGVHVALKANPGRRAHGECGDRGYRPLTPTSASARAASLVARADERHSLSAAIDRGVMRVVADGETVWMGPLPAEALALDGPVGVRADNGDFDLELRAPRRSGVALERR